MITVEQLHFRYRGASAPAVEDVSFSIERGNIFGFLGPSGAGKSTVQKILIRLLPLQQGQVRYDGVPLADLDRDFMAQVGVSFEHPNVFPRLSGRENLRAYAGLYPPINGGANGGTDGGVDRRIDDILERLGLSAAADQWAETYSKGMKQRLVLARSLLHQPRFLFLDEPTSGLDPATARVVMELIREQKERGAVILLTTHDMFVADSLCDQVAFLHRGVIVACDSPRALKLSHGEKSVRIEYRSDAGLQSAQLVLSRAADRERLQALSESGAIETIHSQEATLEQVFVELAGAELLS